ncbi:hypothetical protein [Flavobacterium litorale]|uniref:YbbR-like protein n=1 Tax=Flavobacterium litorale TaxID=2856519 RepID=A0ABX8V870_9FLAO|nr:hypothetical protein [Flavobacterium litorale]QYJ67408.1 hypothetical protein K1I41_07490 [Flavobacterium litorale]
MKTDRYTKTILTIIAVCLVINVLNRIDIIPKAHAGNTTNTITTPVNTNYAMVPINEDGSINVTLKSTEVMDVNLVRINTNDDLDVNVNLQEIGGRNIYGELPIKVYE